MSARAVKAWTWARKLRDSGPASRDFLCAMLTLSTFMNANGFASPSLRTWAKAGRMSVNTLRKHLATAEKLGWLGVESLKRHSQAWKFQEYRAAVPEGTELSEIDQRLSDSLLAEHGEVERRVSVIGDTPHDVEETDTCVTHADTPSKTEGVSPMDDTPEPSNDDRRVSNPSLDVCQTEDLRVSKSPSTCVTQGDTEVLNAEVLKTEVTRHQRKVVADANHRVRGFRETETDEQRSHRISKLIQALPNDSDYQIAKALNVKPEQVRAVRSQCFESVTTTALPRSA